MKAMISHYLKSMIISTIGLFGLVLPATAFAANEALFIEGAVGSTQSKLTTLADSESTLDAKTALLRFHFVARYKKEKILALTLSSHFYDGKIDGPAADQVQLLAYTGAGLGLSYRYHFLIFGGEYEYAAFRLSTVGTGSGIVNFNSGMPHVYGGLMHRFGTLGMGLTYSYKKTDFTAAQTGLSSNHPYEEKSVLFSLTYHFDGTRKFLLRELFVGDD